MGGSTEPEDQQDDPVYVDTSSLAGIAEASGGQTASVIENLAITEPDPEPEPQRTIAQKIGKVTTSEGRAVTGGTGMANVLTTAGAERQAEAEQRYIQSQSDPAATLAELKERRENLLLPGSIGAAAALSLDKQISDLEGGATPVQILSDTGKIITVGTITQDGSYSGREEYGDTAREQMREMRTEAALGSETVADTMQLPITASPTLLNVQEQAARSEAEQDFTQLAPVEEPEEETLVSGPRGQRYFTTRKSKTRLGAAGGGAANLTETLLS